jgi:hypothetical protein
MCIVLQKEKITIFKTKLGLSTQMPSKSKLTRLPDNFGTVLFVKGAKGVGARRGRRG